MRTTKKNASVTTEKKDLVASPNTISNIWVDPTFNLANPKIQNHPKFKELSAAAKNFASLILETTPPGESQKVALDKLNESFMHAGTGFARNAGSSVI